jgi:hypothetical protein
MFLKYFSGLLLRTLIRPRLETIVNAWNHHKIQKKKNRKMDSKENRKCFYSLLVNNNRKYSDATIPAMAAQVRCNYPLPDDLPPTLDEALKLYKEAAPDTVFADEEEKDDEVPMEWRATRDEEFFHLLNAYNPQKIEAEVVNGQYEFFANVFHHLLANHCRFLPLP